MVVMTAMPSRLRFAAVALTAALLVSFTAAPALAADDILPKHITPQTMLSVKAGLDYLARTQNQEGSWSHASDGQSYPVAMASLSGMAFLAHGNTTTRGPYADQVRRVTGYVVRNANANGLICSPREFQGQSMYGHGFALLFLASVHGMENDERQRDRIAQVVNAGIELTARAQSAAGGWTYTPGSGDEGSVTITQLQGLRAARNAGFNVPKATVEKAVRYLELCKGPEGGIVYSLGSGGGSRPAISAAAIAALYNVGEYDSPLAKGCLEYVERHCKATNYRWNSGGGHDYYTHVYAAQAFYQAGDKHWDAYFPIIRDQLIGLQIKQDGSWSGDGIGPVYGTSLALVILQLPYKFLPIYQR